MLILRRKKKGNVIADSTELTVRGHCYDALVGVAGCDKSLPGLMMAMVRLNVPSVFIYGGSILPGRFNGKDITVVDVFEGVGKYSSGKITAHALRKLELKACPTAGACGGQFTANTMACVSEAIGLALPYSAGTPFFTDWACLINAILHGAASFHVETTPTNGLAISFSVKFIA